ncbi:LysE family translocator [Arthrobacter bambusae]|uniref:LysE family translocator n=1 Tax=Arthrobacter bambusae TaxID=1338426 RepID=UPI00277E15E2|nr:LysE family translocator [Arthrobacter bambusae]MDQ0211556.1 threonine/homoserine/homoserine lactone efflux protein [Arthrobacter bambusae]MDQ0236122.1 threonine/homoserine/homoserine lactone efflux protein [Arthrobacter bambusae]
MVEQLMAFALTCVVVVLVPGPDFALVLKNAPRGPGSAATTAIGIMVGNTILALLAVLGVTALLSASEVLGNVIRIAGAAYLLYLGTRALLEAFGRPRNLPTAAPEPRLGFRGNSPFLQGMVSNLLNPKVAVFYLCLFPQFNLAPLPPLGQHALMAGIFLLTALVWYVALVHALKRISTALARPRVKRIITGGSGTVLIGVGGTILTKSLVAS